MIEDVVAMVKFSDNEKVAVNFKMPVGLRDKAKKVAKENSITFTDLVITSLEIVVNEKKSEYVKLLEAKQTLDFYRRKGINIQNLDDKIEALDEQIDSIMKLKEV